MREELILMYREILNNKEKYRNTNVVCLNEDVANFQRLFVICVNGNQFSTDEVEYFFEEIVNQAAPFGTELRKKIDPQISYHNLIEIYNQEIKSVY